MSNDDRNRDAADRWVVHGLLFADNRFERYPGFTTGNVPATNVWESPLRAELLDSEGRVVLQAGIPLGMPCGDRPGVDPSFRMAAGALQLPAKAAAARFLVNDVVVDEFRFPEGEPVTAFTALPGAGASGRLTVAWESEHPSDAALTSIASYSSDDGTTWQPLGLPTAGNELEVDIDALAGGERCRVSVKTTDGVHTVTIVSEPFKLEPRPCVAMILAPGPRHAIARGETLHLQGQGFWLEEQEPEFEALLWSSSLAGPLGRGPAADVIGLEEGKHEITLDAGEGDRVGQATVEVVVTGSRHGSMSN